MPSKAEINRALVMLLLKKLAAFMSFRLAKVGVLELEVTPMGDGKKIAVLISPSFHQHT